MVPIFSDQDMGALRANQSAALLSIR
jgi:hypothetical protein